MKDPIDKFRFDEDSDTGRSHPYHHGNKQRSPEYDSLDKRAGVKQSVVDPGGVYTDKVPNYTGDTSMDYLHSHDLSPLRQDYVLSSPSSQEGNNPTPTHPTGLSAHPTSMYNQQGGGYKQADKPEDYDSGYPVTYGFSDSDQTSNLLTSAPAKTLKDKVVHREFGSDANQSYSSRENGLDLSKSASSGDSRPDYNGGNGGYSERFPPGHPQALKYARDRNLRQARENLRYRSSSLGETTGSTRNLTDSRESKARTPSAPGDLSHRGYQGNQDSYHGYRGYQSNRSLGSMEKGNTSRNVPEAMQPPRQSRIDLLSRNQSQNVLNGNQSQSILSGEYRVHEQNRSLVSGTSTLRTNDSLTGGGGGVLHSTLQNSLYSTSSRPRTPHNLSPLQPNGSAKLIRDKPTDTPVNKPQQTSSSNLSVKLPLEQSSVNSLVSLGLFAILSLVLCFLSLQLLFRLNARTITGHPSETNSVLTNASYGTVLEVTIALATLVAMLDLSCVLVCSMQCFFAAKLLKCQQGEQRCYKYLKECAGTRFIAVTGFFISIPALLLALLLYTLMEFSATPAIVSTVILTVGLTFAAITIVHSLYFWRVEKNKADLNLSPYASQRGTPNKQTLSQRELSTLV